MKFNEDIYPIAGLCFDIDKLQKDLNKIYQVVDYKDGAVRGINLTIPNDESEADARGIFWIKPNASGDEEQREK